MNNSAGGRGGALAVGSVAGSGVFPTMNLVFKNLLFDGNRANVTGGAIYAQVGFENTHFSTAGDHGTNFGMEEITMVNNYAGISGGGLSISYAETYNGAISMVNSTVVGNVAGGETGKLYFDRYFEAPPVMGGGGGISVGIGGGNYLLSAAGGRWPTNRNSAQLYLYNSIVVGNTMRAENGYTAADDIRVSDGYSAGTTGGVFKTSDKTTSGWG